MKNRMESIDIMRGFFIFYVIILHPIIQRVFSQDSSALGTQINTLPKIVVIIGIPFILISLWGSAFTLLTGTATAYQMSMKIKKENGNNTFNLTKNLNKFMISKIVNSGLIWITHFIFISFFFNMSQEHPISTHSLITGSIELNGINSFNPIHLLTSTTLESIALTGLVVSIILYFTWKKSGYNSAKAIKNLGLISFSILLVYLIFNNLIANPYQIAENLFYEKQYLLYYVYSRLFVVRFAIFPVLAFGLIGAIFGILFAERAKIKTILNTGTMLGMFFISIFTIYFANGFEFFANFAEETVPVPLQFLNLGLQIMLVSYLAVFVDFRKKNIKKIDNGINNKIDNKIDNGINNKIGNRIEKTQKTRKIIDIKKVLKRYSSTSLTIFIFEPLISIIYFRIFGLFSTTPMESSIGLILGYIISIVLTWFIILKLWKRNNFKFSIEWALGKSKNKILSYLENKKVQKNNFTDNNFETRKPITFYSDLTDMEENSYNSVMIRCIKNY